MLSKYIPSSPAVNPLNCRIISNVAFPDKEIKEELNVAKVTSVEPTRQPLFPGVKAGNVPGPHSPSPSKFVSKEAA